MPHIHFLHANSRATSLGLLIATVFGSSYVAWRGVLRLMGPIDREIKFRHALAARSLQAMYPHVASRFFQPQEIEEVNSEKQIDVPEIITIPTRHGNMEAYLYTPTYDKISSQKSRGEKPPVHLLIHGGAFIFRYPQEESTIARYLASEVGCYVVVPDYRVAPQVRFPVAEEQCFDALQWLHNTEQQKSWDKERITIGGPSAGGHIALSVTLEAIEREEYVPLALSLLYGSADLTLTKDQRRSTKRFPAIKHSLLRLVQHTYFNGADAHNPRVSPYYHPALDKLPPTLIMAAEYDTLRLDSFALHKKLQQQSNSNIHIYKEFNGVDHGFMHRNPADAAKEAIAMISRHIKNAQTAALGN